MVKPNDPAADPTSSPTALPAPGQSQQIRVPGGYVLYNSSTGKLTLRDGTPLPGWKVGHSGVEKGGKILHLTPTGQPIVETRTTTITPGPSGPTPSSSGPHPAPQPGGGNPSATATGSASTHVTSTYTTLDGHGVAGPNGDAEFTTPQGPGLPGRNDHAGQPHPAAPNQAPQASGTAPTSRSRAVAPPLPHAAAYGNFDNTPVTMGTGLVKQILDAGMGLIGTPYSYGGKDPSQGGIDCSGLISYLYTKVGGAQFNNLKTNADGQSKAGKRVAASSAQPGDLVAFDNDPTKPGADHIGIYLGNGLMLQSPHTGSAVQVVKVDLNSASAISRVLPSNAYAGLGKTAHGLTYQLPSGVTVGGTNPVKIGPAIGGGDGGTGAFGLPPDPTNQQVTDAVAKNFGYLSAFMHDPEIGPILRKAAINGWDQSTLFGALYNTKWWQNTSATTRTWDSDQKLDPATNRSKLAPVLADLTAQAQKAGLTLTPLQLHDISVNSLRFGWDPQQTTNALLAVGKLDVGPNGHPSDALSSKQALKQIAAQYHVPVSDAALDKWTADIIAGRMSTNDFTSYAVEQAKSMFPGLTAALDQGHTVEQYIDPYRQMAATTLDRNPDSFDFINDPKFNAALNQIDPKSGQRTSMSLSDFQTKLKGDPTYGFQKTAAAKASTADIAETINQMWGAVA